MKKISTINNKTPYYKMSIFTKIKLHLVCAKSFIYKYFFFLLLPLAVVIFSLGYEKNSSYTAVKKVKITSNDVYYETRKVHAPRGGGAMDMTFTDYQVDCRVLDTGKFCYLDVGSSDYKNYRVGQVLTTKVNLHRDTYDGWLWTTAVTSLMKFWIVVFIFGIVLVWLGATKKTYEFKSKKCFGDDE